MRTKDFTTAQNLLITEEVTYMLVIFRRHFNCRHGLPCCRFFCAYLDYSLTRPTSDWTIVRQCYDDAMLKG